MSQQLRSQPAGSAHSFCQQLRSSACCWRIRPCNSMSAASRSTTEDAASDSSKDSASQGSSHLVFRLLLTSGMCRHGLRTLFPPWCCLARGMDPKKDPLLLPWLFGASGCIFKTQASEWQHMLANKAVGNIAIPPAAACWLVGHRTLWASDESHEYVTLATPHLHGGASQPADMLREPLLFQDAFPWFPAGFPWTSPQRRFSLVMQGGAAAHMLHLSLIHI